MSHFGVVTELDSDQEYVKSCIKKALQNKISWKSLTSIFHDLTSNLDTSIQIIEILLKELQTLQTKLNTEEKSCKKCPVENVEEFQELDYEFNEVYEHQYHADQIDSDTLKDEGHIPEEIIEVKSNHTITKSSIVSGFDLDEEKINFEIIEEVDYISEEEKSDNLLEHAEFRQIEMKEKKFQCQTCKKRFNLQHHLKRHKVTHTGETPFECKTCFKKFKCDSGRRRHERVHSDEKPFLCKFCGTGFRHSKTLTNHLRIHTGEEPYECKSCGKRFKQIGNMKVHEKSHN